MTDHALAAVIPTIDEALAIGRLVRGLRSSGACCAFVIDGGSGDGTPEIATAAGATVVHEPRRGYGRACLTGASVAIDTGHTAVAFLDGDGSCDPDDLPALASALGRADVVLGQRRARRIEPSAMPWHARAGNLLVAAIVSLRTGRRVSDMPPFKVFRSAALERLALDDPGYGWTVQSVARSLSDRNLRVAQRPVAFRRRQGGRSKVSGSWRASLAAGRAMVTVAWRETRPRPVLALMAKAPRDGHAKTRLAADIGQDGTRSLWAACLTDGGAALGAAALRAGLEPLAIVPTARDAAIIGDLVGPAWSIAVQRRARLSGALVDTFVTAFDRGARWAVAVAADSPTLPPSLLADAAHALRTDDDAVLGPCPDGGYYLVGLRWRRRLPMMARRQRRRLTARLERAFQQVSMGGADAMSSTVDALRRQEWHPRVLGTWVDLDVGRDLGRFADTVTRHPGRFPNVHRWLVENEATVRLWTVGPPA